MIGLAGHIIKSILKTKPTHIAIPEGTVYFSDKSFSKLVPVFVHYQTKVGIEIRMNGWVRSKRAIAKKAKKLAMSIEASSDIDKIKPGEFASGLLRTALESNHTQMVVLDRHYFERIELELEMPTGTVRFHSFQCLVQAF